MGKAARWIEIAIGVFFLVSAAAKAVNMEAFGVQISAYNVVKDAGLVRGSAYFALAVEVLLGAALVAGLRYRGATHLVSAGMIVVYSTLVVYAWQWHGLEDCGCLGQWISMGPVETLIKNAILVALIGFAWVGGSADPAAPPSRFGRPVAAAGMGLVFALAAYDLMTQEAPVAAPGGPVVADASRPFAQFVFEADGEPFDLGQGEYLVPLLNATCEHCRASVPALNELYAAGGMPDMVSLMMGNESEIEEFRLITSPLFALHRIDTLKFMEFIGTSPPRLVHVKDGVQAKHWDWQDDVPSADIIASVAAAD